MNLRVSVNPVFVGKRGRGWGVRKREIKEVKKVWEAVVLISQLSRDDSADCKRGKRYRAIASTVDDTQCIYDCRERHMIRYTERASKTTPNTEPKRIERRRDMRDKGEGESILVLL